MEQHHNENPNQKTITGNEAVACRSFIPTGDSHETSLILAGFIVCTRDEYCLRSRQQSSREWHGGENQRRFPGCENGERKVGGSENRRFHRLSIEIEQRGQASQGW